MEREHDRTFAERVRAWLISDEFRTLAAAVATCAGIVAAVISGRAALRALRLAGDGARLLRAAATLRLYRRCPDCRRWLRGDAMVCSRCGFRRPRRRHWPRPRGRF
jgi:hypothetical protein